MEQNFSSFAEYVNKVETFKVIIYVPKQFNSNNKHEKENMLEKMLEP